MLSDMLATARSWIEQPFKTPIDLGSLFLIVGVVLVAIIFWLFIIHHIVSAAEEI